MTIFDKNWAFFIPPGFNQCGNNLLSPSNAKARPWKQLQTNKRLRDKFVWNNVHQKDIRNIRLDDANLSLCVFQSRKDKKLSSPYFGEMLWQCGQRTYLQF